jgi:nitronate monooxygenase
MRCAEASRHLPVGVCDYGRGGQALEAGGLDAVIAQGFEAGGHRGTFCEPFELGEIGLFSLLPQVVDAVRIPVVAARGIADGRGIAAALALGAKGVQLGTAFLGSPEAAIDPLFRRTLHEPRAAHTQLTRAFTGRPARAIATRFIREMAADAANTLEFPLQYGLTAPLGRAAASKNDPEFLAMWAGQSAPLVRTLIAAELIETLELETERALHRLARPFA